VLHAAFRAARARYDDTVSRNDDSRLVYSTATAGKCPTCGWPQKNCQCSTRHTGNARIPERITAKLRVEKSGRGGKTVTVVYGLPDNDTLLKELSQKLKRACGVGGTTAEASVELQGDVRDRVRTVLQQLGYGVKG
jgi:translation initiation factor 1